MKKNFKLNVFIFMLSLTFFLPKLSADSESPLPNAEPNISMDFQDANLKDVLKVFSMQSGLNFIASEALQERKITLYLDNVPLGKTMDELFRANNISYELDEEANIFVVKDWGKPEIETVTKVFYLKHATVSSASLKAEMSKNITTGIGESGITQAVKKILSGYGSLIEDFRTNSFIITDIPIRMPIIAQTIAALDVPVAQVMLEVEMLDVSKNTIDTIGFKFGQTPLTMVLTGAKWGTLWPYHDTSLPVASQINLTPGSIDFSTTGSSYTVLLDFLKKQSDTKYLARPRILTLNNETAEIKITTMESIGKITTVTTGTSPVTTEEIERIETGVSLRVTPQINTETGEITMFIMPVVRDATTSTLFGAVVKDPEERSTKSIVRIKDGETVIIGGLIRNESTQTISKLPILGDIPVLGALFRHKSKDKDKERELLVFITPHIVKDATIELAQAKKVTLLQREQNTVSGIDRQAVINTSLDSLEKKHR